MYRIGPFRHRPPAGRQRQSAPSPRVRVEPLEARQLLATVAEADLFGPGQSVHVSGTDASPAFTAANLVDGTSGAFRFNNGSGAQRLAVSNFNAAITTLRLYDAPSYADRAPFLITVYHSPLKQLSVTPAGYALLGTFSLPTINTGGAAQGDVYPTPTDPPDYPRATDPLSDPTRTIGYAELSGLAIPPGTQSILLDFGANPAGLGFGLSEIQAMGYETAARPAEPTLNGWGRNVYQKINASLKVPGSNLYAETASTSGARSGGDSGFAYVWPAATQFRVLNALVRTDPTTYRPVLRAFANELHTRYWRNSGGGYRSGVSSGATLFYDDNAHLAVSLAEAFHLTGERVYLDRAIQTYNFVISGEDAAGGGGIYFSVPDRSSKDAISTLQAARGALMLHQLTGDARYLADATRLYTWAATHIQQPDGLFHERFRLTSPTTGFPEGATLINSLGIGLATNVLFYDSTGEPRYLAEAQRLARASIPRYFSSSTGAINDEGFWAFELVDGLGDLYLHDRNPTWRDALVRALRWLHDNREDPNGHYGTLWARDAFAPGTIRPSWHLNDQAAVARSYLHTAALDTVASPFVTAPGDPVTAIYVATVGGNATRSSAGTGTGQYPSAEGPTRAVDGNAATKYLNYGNGSSALSSATKGVGTGFYVTPALGPSVVTGIRVATGGDRPNRDPLTVSIEGTNAIGNFDSVATWTLIADDVNLGINADPGRQAFGPIVRFANSAAYRSYRVIVKSQRGVDNAVQYAEMSLVGSYDVAAGHAVVGRHVFYNNSAFDTPTPTRPTAGDDDAIAPDKQALLPGGGGAGGGATFNSVTSYVRGINGIMVDVAGASAGFGSAASAGDFLFEVPVDAAATAWRRVPAPSSISVRPLTETPAGIHRVTFTWPDHAIKNTWLRVTALPNMRTNLPRPDVFYFGNLVGETGDNAGAPRVNALDAFATRRALSTRAVELSNRFDFNRDGRVNALDVMAVRSNLGASLPTVTASVFGVDSPARVWDEAQQDVLA